MIPPRVAADSTFTNPLHNLSNVKDKMHKTWIKRWNYTQLCVCKSTQSMLAFSKYIELCFSACSYQVLHSS